MPSHVEPDRPLGRRGPRKHRSVAVRLKAAKGEDSRSSEHNSCWPSRRWTAGRRRHEGGKDYDAEKDTIYEVLTLVHSVSLATLRRDGAAVERRQRRHARFRAGYARLRTGDTTGANDGSPERYRQRAAESSKASSGAIARRYPARLAASLPRRRPFLSGATTTAEASACAAQGHGARRSAAGDKFDYDEPEPLPPSPRATGSAPRFDLERPADAERIYGRGPEEESETTAGVSVTNRRFLLRGKTAAEVQQDPPRCWARLDDVDQLAIPTMSLDLLWRDVAASRSDRHIGALDLHVEAVKCPVLRRRGERHQVLVMQLVCDASKCRGEVRRALQLEVATAAYFGQRLQAWIWSSALATTAT